VVPEDQRQVDLLPVHRRVGPEHCAQWETGGGAVKYALLLNDMRQPNIENITIVRISDDRQLLVDWYNSQLADKPYQDGRWGKVFKPGSELEWYNSANMLLNNDYWGGIWEVPDHVQIGMGLYKGAA
jgi:hypothetical protein